jgi:putative MATE family efflux protein
MKNTRIKPMAKHPFGEMDLTSGNLFWKLPLFALPMAITTILQLLYSTVDLYTVAQFGGGANSMSAVGSNTALINLVIVFFVSFSMGANVVMANAKGANDKLRASKCLHTSMVLSLITGVFIGIIGYFVSPTLLKWMGTPVDILEKATLYLQVYFFGLPFLMIYNYGSQILRALGDSKTPLYILIITGIANVGFDLLFVIVLKGDVLGVAWATVLSEAVSAFLVVLWLFLNKKGYVSLHLRDMKMDSVSLKSIIRIGLPSGIQGLGFYIPGVLIQSSLYSLTSEVINNVSISVNEVVAGNAASSTIEGYVYAFVEAFATAATSFASQNYGANKKENIKKIFWYSLIWAQIACFVCSIIVFFASDPLLKVFITESEGVSTSNAILAGRLRLYIIVFTYFLDAIMDVSSFYLRGLGHSTSPSVVTIACCVGIRILFIYALFPLPIFHNLLWLLLVYPISWLVASAILIPMVIFIANKEIRLMKLKEEKIQSIMQKI